MGNIGNYKKILDQFIYKAGKVAIGCLAEDNKVFQFNEIQLQKGDTIYLSSDGYADQFRRVEKY
jgi:serine phosphatase RsbU (regulator of sigma subunit)